MPSKPFSANLADLPKESLFGGAVQRTAVEMDNALSVSIWNNLTDGETPFMHSHPFDQLSYVFGGTMEITVGDEVHTVGPNGVVYIPANMVHGGRIVGDTPTFIIDTFSPVRDDYRHLIAGQRGLESVGEPPAGNVSNVVDHGSMPTGSGGVQPANGVAAGPQTPG